MLPKSTDLLIEQPLPDPESRVICLTMKRALVEDQMIVEFSKVLSGTLMCNTATLQLGPAQDAKTAIYYHTKYTSKNPCELQVLRWTEAYGTSEMATIRMYFG